MIGTPIDSGTAAPGTTTDTQVKLTTSRAITAGSHIIVVGYTTGARTVTTPTDDSGLGLAWQVDATINNSNGSLGLCSAYCPSGLPKGTIITIPMGASQSASRAACAMEVSGLDPTTWFDKSASFQAAAQAAWDTGTTAATAKANEIAIAFAAEAGSSATTSTVSTSGYTELHDFVNGAGRCLTSAYLALSSTGAQRCQGTFTTSTGSVAGIIGTYIGVATALDYGFEDADTATFTDVGSVMLTSDPVVSGEKAMQPGVASYRVFTVVTSVGIVTYVRFYARFSAGVASGTGMMLWVSNNGAAETICTVRLDTDADRRISLRDKGGTVRAQSGKMDLDVYHRVEIAILQDGADGGKGSLRIDGSDIALDVAGNFGTNTLDRLKLGDIAADSIPSLYLDSIAASNSGWIGADPDVGASPVVPTAVTGSANAISATAAALHGTVSPGNDDCAFYFEYGTTTGYGTSIPAGKDGVVAGKISPATVAESVTGLDPETTYHYRLVAVNSAGTSKGADATFVTHKVWDPPTKLFDRIIESPGSVFYVAVDGSDSNPGTAGQPWATIKHALDTVSAGSIVEVADGSYVAPSTTSPKGTAKAPITLRAAAGAQVTTTFRFKLDGAEYLRIQDINHDGVLSGNTGVWFANGCKHCEWLRGSSHEAATQNFFSEITNEDCHWIDAMVYLSGRSQDDATHNLYHGMYISGNRMMIYNCLIFDNDARGIQYYPGCTNSIIAHNTLVGNGRAGIQVAGDENYASSGNRVFNNISAYNEYGIRGGWNATGPFGQDNLIEDNLVYGNTIADYWVPNDPSTLTITRLDLGDDGVERVPNGEFETDLTGWVANAPVPIIFTHDDNWANVGKWSLRFQWTNASKNVNNGIRTLTELDGIPITPGRSIKVAAVVNVVTIPANSLGTFLRVGWYDAAGASLSETLGDHIPGTGILNLGGTFTAPDDTAFYSIGVSTESGDGGSFDGRLDSVSSKFTRSAEPEFLDLAARDLRVKVSSPAVGRADPDWSPANDFAGRAR